MPRTKPTIIVSGMIAADPGQGGAAWAVLQYLLGLQELGCDVCFIEPIKKKALHRVCVTLPPGQKLLASAISDHVSAAGSKKKFRRPASFLQQSTSAAYFSAVMDEFHLQDRAALLLSGTRETCGLGYDELLSIAARADALINISGMLTDDALLARVPVRAYLDLDPAFNQWWHSQGIDMRFGGHTHFITIGQALGEPTCPAPSCGLNWIRTFQPVVLSHWPVADVVRHDAFTTVGNWRSYGSVEAGGVFYGQKAHSLRQFISLPLKSSERFLLAMAIWPEETADLKALSENRWQLIDPAQVTATPAAYRGFIGGSFAELGIAKSGYALSRCGWFSDRSVCYLASGRPVLAQETGFSDYLPTGRGLLAFDSVDDAVAAIDEIRGNYAAHRRAARQIAEEFFDARKVLSRLLQELGVGI